IDDWIKKHKNGKDAGIGEEDNPSTKSTRSTFYASGSRCSPAREVVLKLEDADHKTRYIRVLEFDKPTAAQFADLGGGALKLLPIGIGQELKEDPDATGEKKVVKTHTPIVFGDTNYDNRQHILEYYEMGSSGPTKKCYVHSKGVMKTQ